MQQIQQNQLPITPAQIIDILIRRRWIIVIPLCITLTVGLYLALTSPRTYMAETSILVQAQTVPGNYVKSIVSSGISSRISTISQQIMSMSNLEKIIDQFGLFEEEGAKDMYLEDKIEAMRKRIKVTLSSARSGADAFTISYKGSDPDKVMRITNTLTSFFMDENLKLREAQAIGTSEFLDAELEKTRKKLVDREEQLSSYRAKNMGGLPDELDSNLRTLDRLQLQLTDKQAMLRDAKNAINTLSAQIAQASKMGSQGMDDQFDFSDFGEEVGMGGEDEATLAEAEKRLDAMLLRYTRQHPDVRRLEAVIEKLRAKIEAAQAQEAAETLEPLETENLDVVEPGMNFAVMQQKTQLAQMNREIQALNAEIKSIQEKMVVYQKRVEDTPKKEQDLLSLKRDYANIQSVFNSLLDRKLEAELSVNMEKKQKGEQFRILDHARIPEKPISPDVRKMLVFSLAAGLGVAGGIIFLLEVLDFSIRRDEDIEKLGLLVLASIPPLKNPGDRLKKRLEMIFLSLAATYALVMLAAFIVLNDKGLDRVVNFIKSFING
ncbi:GumC1 [Desulforapulum autotrophicum HRM2]|uniref:GumC1 n=1 Tax=Desulforapulum autotrophicum (strain ATCC 43914 / DSM 3382 / VKM B-1955 / HRM2) TaxID=177437 RepID=C0QCJ1_DESAH|nr:GNVR domain-containing protein [Desulforapulum autotrophicum]ACN15068.1 GumC1 [Desulforapulum autotrophicum HRM2]